MKTNNKLLRSLKDSSFQLFQKFQVIYNKCTEDYYSFSQFPYYTDHSVKHIDNIFDNLSKIIPEKLPEPLSTYELFALLTASLFHNFGMLSFQSDQDNASLIRKGHIENSDRYLSDNMNTFNLSPNESKIVSNISDESAKIKDEVHNGELVRISLLAALLRLANILDVTFDRSPFFYKKLIGKEVTSSISNIKINSFPSWEIILDAYSTSKSDDIELNKTKNFLQNELDYLYPILRRYNIFYKEIKLIIRHKDAPQLFISYAHQDKNIALKISSKLNKMGVDVWYDNFDLVIGDSLINKIESTISSMDYLIVLLSPNSVNSNWVQKELDIVLSRELDSRAITIIPVLIADCELPTFLKTKQYIDLRKNLDVGIHNLTTMLQLAPTIDFSKLNARRFEDLVIELLLSIGFSEIKKEPKIDDKRYDLLASLETKDPFATTVKDSWIVEIKFYEEERLDLKYLRKTIEGLINLPEKYSALFITNGNITTPSENFLNAIKSIGKIDTRIITGTELKRLLIKHPELIDRFFRGDKLK